MPSEKTLRKTRQRRVILEVLRAGHTHPTAAEIYDDVRKELPHISLGTIYRNLETLANFGVIQKLEGVGTQKRFDGRLENHHHIQCVNCLRIDDVILPSSALGNSIDNALKKNSDYDIIGYRIAFVGICPHCR